MFKQQHSVKITIVFFFNSLSCRYIIYLYIQFKKKNIKFKKINNNKNKI